LLTALVVSERRRTVIWLQLGAVVVAGAGLLALEALSGPAQTCLVLLALATAGSLGVISLRGLDREEHAREDARNLKAELLRNVSHELRTPLNAILGYAEILDTMPELDDDEREQMVTRILSNAVNLTCAVNNLLAYSAVVAGDSGLRPAPVLLSELFEELEPWVGRLIDEKPIAFAWNVDPNLPPLETDRSKLRQMILNVLANSAKFTLAGEIKLSARRSGTDGIEIAVDDTGVGMSPTEQASIFEDFRQVCGATTRPFSGMGLGLTLAQRFCELLGGSIAVESVPAKGTRVALQLPFCVPAAQTIVGVAGARS
jgi:signal transduction histidine kinase